jgi:Rps23 Pro-64 3,4-dihydroxylase Tpa1-like proline 4-hydroxylase
MNKDEIKSLKKYVEPQDAQSLINLMDELKSKGKLNNERGDGTFRLYNSDHPVLFNFVKKYSDKFIGNKNLYLTEYLVALYEEGAFMSVHRDVEDEFEVISTVMYLNDEYTGGELSFPEVGDGYAYTPEKYELVYFPTPFLHGVNPVTSGKRYIITISYTDKPENKNIKYMVNKNANI